jgi:hypothetical protein
MVLNRHEGIQKGFALGLTLHLLCITKVCKIGTMGSVADPGCLSRIKGQNDSGSRTRFCIEEFTYF